MFLLRRRVPSIPRSNASDFTDSNSVDPFTGSSLDCSTPGVKRSRTDQPLSTSRPNTLPRGRALRRRLSENEKTRISIYLRLLNGMFAVMVSMMKTLGQQFVAAVDLIKVRGTSELLYLVAAVAVTAVLLVISVALYAIVLVHQALVWALSTFLLVNVSFFSLRPYPPDTKEFQMKRRASLTASMVSLSPVSTEPVASQSNGQRISMDVLPLIDLSSRSSGAGDTPEVLVPAVLSPTQLQLRSLSPAFDQSIKAAKEGEIAELLSRSSSKPTTPQPPTLGALLSRRGTLGSLMADVYGSGRPVDPGRSMSTVSYPDVGEGFSTSDEGSEMGAIMEDEREGSIAVQYSGRTDIEDDEDYEDDETENPRPDEEVSEIPYTSSPSQVHAPLSFGPEAINVLDPESRKASMDVAGQETKFTFPEPMGMPVAPSSQVAHPPVPNNTLESTAADSPRDVFSPTPVSFPQPISSLPFAFPFLREQLHQRSSSESSESGARWNFTGEAEAETKKKDDRSAEPTPYPSPPFTPPSTRPPTMYTSMAPALQMPTADANLNPFVTERSQLSALVEEAKADLESEKKDSPAQLSPRPDNDSTLGDQEESVEAISQQSPPARFPEPAVAHAQTDPEVTSMPAETVSPVTELPPARAISPVNSIGQGGVASGSRINVDDLHRYPTPSWKMSSKEDQSTLAAASAEEPLNEVNDAAAGVDDDELPERPFSPAGVASGADDESTAPKSKTDMRKKKKKTKRPKNKKGVSFDEVPFVIGSEQEGEQTSEFSDANVRVNPVVPSALSLPSPSVSSAIPVPRSFEVEDDEDSEAPILRPTSNLSNEVFRGSPVPSRMSVLSDSRRDSIFSTGDEMSDSSFAMPSIPGEFSAKQVDHYARWFARAHRDKALPTIQVLRDQMKECSETELASRLKLGSRSDATKLSKTLVGEDLARGTPSGGVVPPVRKGSFRRSRR